MQLRPLMWWRNSSVRTGPPGAIWPAKHSSVVPSPGRGTTCVGLKPTTAYRKASAVRDPQRPSACGGIIGGSAATVIARMIASIVTDPAQGRCDRERDAHCPAVATARGCQRRPFDVCRKGSGQTARRTSHRADNRDGGTGSDVARAG